MTPNHLPVEKPVGVTVNDGYTGSLSYGSRSASRATLNNSRYRGDEPLDKVQKLILVMMNNIMKQMIMKTLKILQYIQVTKV